MAADRSGLWASGARRLEGEREGDGRRPLRLYGFVAYSVLSYAAGEKGSGSGSSDKDAQDIKVLDWPAGQWIVGIAGAAVAGAGAQIAVRAVTHKFKKHLKMSDMSPKTRKVVNSLNFSEYRFV